TLCRGWLGSYSDCHTLNRDSVNYPSFQSSTASDRLLFSDFLHYIYCLFCQCVSSEDKNFDREDLRGVNFQGANLVDISFIGANLSKANFQEADLSRAKLVQTQLDHTDFTGATLTGAFIQDWGITTDTKFDGVRCEYVYMRLPTAYNPNPLRKPDNRGVSINGTENWVKLKSLIA
ncbi:pentapeptide repeat-containing protein, partial [Nostoc sp. WHI]|uniref:pentapeptide repeat-containing protein n=1 Tax=Nostoc sp. WHI TaxID=2650611 RepID=UPI001E5FF7D6